MNRKQRRRQFQEAADLVQGMRAGLVAAACRSMGPLNAAARKYIGMRSMLVKQFASPVSIDLARRSVTMTISTPTRDRQGDVVDPQGMDLTDYKRNPIVLWQHNPAEPIGQSRDPETGKLAIAITAQGVLATCFFSRASPLAEQVFQQVCEGVLNAASIGFRVLEEPARLPDEEGYPPGWLLAKTQLLEWSIVSVPACPDAVIERSSKEQPNWSPL